MPALPVDHELIDQAWYTALDGLRIGKWDADGQVMVYPGVGEAKVIEPMLRLGPVARYRPPIKEPTNLGAVIVDGKQNRFVRIFADLADGRGLAWYRPDRGVLAWDELAQPITVLAKGVPANITGETE